MQFPLALALLFAAPVAFAVTLTVSPTPTGGRVTSVPGSIDCGGARFPGTVCSGSFTAFTTVTLTATPDPGYTFLSWTGSLGSSTSNPLKDTMPNFPVTLTANFARPPGAPTIGTATPGDASASVAFTPPASTGGSPITSYLVTATPGGATSTGPASPIVVGSLANGTTYTFNVRATNVAGTGAASAESAPVTPRTVPDPPVKPIAQPGNAQVTLRFAPPVFDGGAPISSYRVTASPGGNFTVAAASPITVAGLANATEYTFTVTATNAAGTSAPATVPGSYFPSAPPGAPAAISAVAGTASADVTVTPPASPGSTPVQGYLVSSVPSGYFSLGGTDQAIERLTPGAAYRFVARARNLGASGPATAASNSVIPFASLPGAPGNAAIAAAGSGRARIDFTWPDDDGGATVTGFTASCSPSAGAFSAFACKPVTGRNPHACSVMASGLANGVLQSCSVRATNAVGTGAASSVVRITPAANLVVPPGPPSITLAVPGEASATLAFDPPAYDGGMAITGYKASCSPGSATATGTASPLTVTGLANGIPYSCTVAAKNSLTYGTGAVAVVVTPKAASPAAVRPISAGSGHNLMLSPSGQVWAWGENNSGKLGNGTKTGSSVAVRSGTLEGVVSIAAGSTLSVAVKGDGTVWVWGRGAGRYCDGTDCRSPVRVTELADAADAAVGADHVLVRMKDGTVRAWGSNHLAQLGIPDFSYRHTPAPVAGLTGVVAVAAGHGFSLALKDDGTVRAWGTGIFGQLGTGDTPPETCLQGYPYGSIFVWEFPCARTPVAVPGLSGITAIAAGGRHALALKNDGTVWSWGSGRFGQLGRGTMANGLTPLAVPGLAGIVQVAAGHNHSVAIGGDGTVWAWGLGHLGQLGILATDTCPAGQKTHCLRSPTAVPLLAGAATVVAGGGHTIAVRGNGALVPVGYNISGQLGYGVTTGGETKLSTIDPGVPILIGGASGTTTGLGAASTTSGINLSEIEHGINFPGIAVGSSSPPIEVRFTNLQDLASVDVTGVWVDGNFSQTNDCGATLAPDQHCTIQVTFTPSSAGDAAGTLTVGTSLPDSPQASLALHGVGLTAPGITSANTATFAVGAASTFTVTTTGSPPPTLSIAGALPGGVSFAPITQVLAGTPVATGSFPLTFTASNGVGADAIQAFTLVVSIGAQAIDFGAIGSKALGTPPFTLSATATSGLPVAFASTTPSVCTVSGNVVTLLALGTCTIQASQAGNAQYGAATPVTRSFAVVTASAVPRLANISTRMQVLTGDNVLIGGFIIGGTQPKTIVVRARGPSLAPYGITNFLADPTLSLYSGQTVIASNDDWQQAANAPTLFASGFAPELAQESAIHTTLEPGPYTAIVSGAGGTTGVGIVEVFEVDRPEIPLLNISTRGAVLTGNDVMIGGFVIQGDGPQTVIVRARGPSLAAFGVPNVLANPLLQLFSGQTQIAVNDNWQEAANAAEIQSRGFAPANAFESAILVTLTPGAYTAIVTGAGGTTGVGIIEVFAQ